MYTDISILVESILMIIAICVAIAVLYIVAKLIRKPRKLNAFDPASHQSKVVLDVGLTKFIAYKELYQLDMGKTIKIKAFDKRGDAIASYEGDDKKTFIIWNSDRLALKQNQTYEIHKRRDGETWLEDLSLRLTSEGVSS